MRATIKQVKKILTKLPLIIAAHAFWTCLILVLISLSLGAHLFYKYGILAQKTEPESLEQSIIFREKAYQQVLEVWQEQEQRFQEADSKEYTDLFLEAVPFPDE